MNASSFEIGQVVQIDPDDVGFDRDWSLRRKYGEVVAVDPDHGTHCVQVNMGVNFRRDLYERLVQGVGWFMPSELEIQASGWAPPGRADFLFGASWTNVHSFKEPWSSDCPCMHEDHDGEEPPMSNCRGMINVHGSTWNRSAN